MPPPTITRSAFVGEDLHDAEFVFDLGAAGDGHEGPLRRRRGAPAACRLHAASSDPAALGSKSGRHHDRGVGAVRRTEGLIDVVVKTLDQRRAEVGVVGLFAADESAGSRVARRSNRARAGTDAAAPRENARRLVPRDVRSGCGRDHVAPGSSNCSKSGKAEPQAKVIGDLNTPSTSATGALKSTRTSTRLP